MKRTPRNVLALQVTGTLPLPKASKGRQRRAARLPKAAAYPEGSLDRWVLAQYEDACEAWAKACAAQHAAGDLAGDDPRDPAVAQALAAAAVQVNAALEAARARGLQDVRP